MNEQAVRFGTREGLVGIITHPAASAHGPAAGVILLNSGILHRPGPQRVYVLLARALAEAGLAVMRFDFSGIGDSEARADVIGFSERTLDETRQAMACLSSLTGVRRFVVGGICSGAQAAVHTGARDDRVVGVMSINHAAHRGAGGRDFGRTMVRHYARLIFSSSFSGKAWSNLMSGQIDRRRLAETGRSLVRRATGAGRPVATTPANRFLADVQALVGRRVPTLLLHSEGDEGLDYSHIMLRGPLRHRGAPDALELRIVQGANHTFTLVPNQQDLVADVMSWSRRFLTSEGQGDE